MTSTTRRIAIAAALAACGLVAQAQTAQSAPPAPMQGMAGMHGMHDGPAMQQRMQERMQRRMDSLKRILQIAPQQEGAWNAWVAAMRPNVQAMQQRHQLREEMARLTTPERIDRLRQLRAQRSAEMDRKAEATKTLYAQLTPPQQKAFDEVSLRFLSRGRGHGGMHHGG